MPEATLQSPSLATRIRQRAAPLPPRALSETVFVVIDTETTSADPMVAGVIEIAARGWSLHPERHLPRTYETYVNPGFPIPPESSAVHHITDEKVATAPTLAGQMEHLLAFIEDCPLIAHNAEYDRTVLRDTPLYNQPWIDTYRLAMRTWSIGEKNEQGFPLASFQQQVLRYWLGLPKTSGDAHRAGADIQVTGHIFTRAVSRYLQAGLPDDYHAFMDWLASPIPHQTMPFGTRSMVGKKPEELEDWELRRVFDEKGEMFQSFQRFNVLDFLRPELMRRQGVPLKPPSRHKSFRPGSIS